MVSFGGTVLRLSATVLYAIEFCCAAIILGVYSYFLAVLSNHNLAISQDWKAVEGISGAAVLYTIFAVCLTIFLGGFAVFAFLGLAFDILFCAAFIALAILTRDGDESCSGHVNTPLGSGPANSKSPGYGQNGFGFGGGETITYFPNLGLACRLNSAAFAVSIIGAFLFLFSAILQIFVAQHHRKEKKYGPSPANNYTSGSGSRRNPFRRRRRQQNDALPATYNKDAEAGVGAPGPTGGLAAPQDYNQMRTSHETGYTGTTVTQPTTDYSYGANKAEHSGYHTAPTGTAVNPYGYDHTGRNAASNF